jgi:putative ATP-binding cassette transporter
MWGGGHGLVVRPPLDEIVFVPQQPYLPPGTLRQALVGAESEEKTSDERIVAALHATGLHGILERVGGLHVEREWPKILLLGEQQQLVLVRLLLAQPCFAMLDRVSTTLGVAQLERWLQRLSENQISYINFDEVPRSAALYDAVLEVHDGGTWTWELVGAARPAVGIVTESRPFPDDSPGRSL